MKDINYFNIILLVVTFFSCSNDNNSDVTVASQIDIENYRFTFPSGFELIPRQGLDSYVGDVVGLGITLTFDYGRYNNSFNNLPQDEYITTEDEINGHFRRIIKPFDHINNDTTIYIYKISDSIQAAQNSDFYDSLRFSTNNISLSEQELVINAFNSVVIID